jgi:uncharacterized membrane protein
MKSVKKINIPIVLVILFFGIIYSLISLVNHYNFRTYSLDLGIYNQALYHYAHFSFNNNTILSPDFGNILSDHFELLIPLFSPFYYVFGSYTLLIIQIVALLFGGYGIYKYVFFKTNQKGLSIAAMLQYFLFFGVFSALSFDYHSNVIAASILPWFLYFFEKKQLKYAVLFFSLILLSKENMALWMIFVCLGLVIMNFRDKFNRNQAFILMAVSIVFFITVVTVLIPSLAPEGRRYLHFQFSALGENFREALITIVTRPLYAAELLFVNHTNAYAGDYLKIEFYILLFFSGGIFLFYRPVFLVMIIPLIAQKMYNDFSTTWGLGAHYNVEFAPLIAICSFFVIGNIKKSNLKKVLMYAVPILTLLSSMYVFDNSICYIDHARIRIYQAKHYTRAYDITDVYSAMKLIPDAAAVSAHSSFVSHLAFRDKIYAFPAIQDAEYILVSSKEEPYFLSRSEFNERIDSLKHDKNWCISYQSDNVLLLKKQRPTVIR